MTGETPELTISIVSSGGWDFIEKCLCSILGATKDVSFEIYVVDNTCGGIVSLLREKFPEAKLIVNEVRKGFSANHNQVIRASKGRLILLLNDDTVIFPEAIDKMAAFLRERPDTGLLGCKLENPDGTLQISCFRTPSLTELFCDAFLISNIFPWFYLTGGFRKWPHDTMREVPFVSGAAMMFPRAVVEKVGFLDETFFTYAEDADWCKRIREAGYKVMFLPDARIIHYGGGSGGSPGYDAFHNFHRSRLLYFLKHGGALAATVAAALDIIGATIRIVLLSVAYPFAFSRRREIGERIIFFKRRMSWYFTKALNIITRRNDKL